MLTVPGQLLADMIAHARREAPREAVGLLACEAETPTALVGLAPLNNRSPTPECAFFVMPYEQYVTEVAFSARGWRVAAAYHSHPNRDAEPSGMDTEFLSGTRPMFIVSLYPPEFAVRCWAARDGHTEEIQFEVMREAA